MNKPVLIGSASGWGAQIKETEFGPDAFKAFLKDDYIWDSIIYPKYSCTSTKPNINANDVVYNHIEHLSRHVHNACKHNNIPVIIGGDHASGIATWSGVTTALSAEGNFGLIWIDAHMDSHTISTSPSGAYHGMPIASLLGEGESKFAHIINSKTKISPQHLCLIGIRSYEKGEEDLLNKLGVKVYLMEEVINRGFAEVYAEALQIVKTGTKGYGVSIDLDGFDPKDAPAVGSRENNGLKKSEILPILKKYSQDTFLKALEIAEYNPKRENKNQTAQLLKDILDSFF